MSVLNSVTQDEYVRQHEIISASVGQHVRHSLFHVKSSLELLKDPHTNVNYDERPREDEIETSLTAAKEAVQSMLDSLPTSSSSSSSSSTATNTPVNVTFKTTPSINTTFPSSLSRELFFASHHSLHHLSSVKIALTSMGVGAASDLGKAPSTVAHESSSDDSPSSDDDSPLIYHTAWFCPFAHRCTLALSHHSLPHTPVESLGWSKRPSSDGQTTHDHWYHYKNPDLLAANPLGMVPTLVQGSKVCTESLACIDFVDAMGEGTSLIPSDPWEAARCRVWSEKVAKDLCSPYYKILVNQDADVQAQAFEGLKASIVRFGEEVEKTEGDLFAGEGLCNVDLSLFPWAWRYYVFEHYRGPNFTVTPQSLPAKEYTPFFRWLDAMLDLDAVVKTLPDKDRYLEHIGKYADGSARSKVAEAVRRGVEAHEYDDVKDLKE